MPYHLLSLLVRPEREDLLAAELWDAGTRGLEISETPDGRSLVRAYFDGSPPGAAALAERVGAELTASEAFPDRDWLAIHRRWAVPIEVGRRLLVEPGEPNGWRSRRPLRGERRILRIPARRAFGTGSHASTRLAVELLEDLDLDGLRLLDVGTGSGILALAALVFGARSAVGLDCDPQAVLLAAQNAGLNGLSPMLLAGRVTCLSPRTRFDVVLANVPPEEILPDLPALRRLVRDGGVAIFSGWLATGGATAAALLGTAGFLPLEARTEGEWTALRTVAV